MENILTQYQHFVDTLTSTESKDFDAYIKSLTKLKESSCDIARLDTALTGMMTESAEAMEILKKMKFQGKPWTSDIHQHLVREAGDVIFYWVNMCFALGVSPTEVILKNISKLEARYPGGRFEVQQSEIRKENDI